MDADELEEQIKAQVEEWSSNSNDCFTVDLLRGDGSKAASFQPEFTYPIFGEEEAIFGYQGLSINLAFAAHDLQPHLSVSYEKKFQVTGEVRPTDIHEALRDFLPESAFSNETASKALRKPDAASFKPPGKRVLQYKHDGSSYEIWCASLSDPEAKRIIENVGILVPMFIEGGTMLQIEQDWTTQRWKLFLLYNIREKPDAGPTYSKYSLVGYGTSYRVFTFPDRHQPLQTDLDVFTPSQQSLIDFLPPPETAIPNDYAPTSMPNNLTTPLDLPSRERLSQFLVLPDYQGGGHGQRLYNTMYHTLTNPGNVREFTVEDPNEAFDDLRDLCDLIHLRSHNPDFASLRIHTDVPADKLVSGNDIPTALIVPAAARESIMKETKIMQRQFDRLVEMHTLSFIPSANRSRSRITRKEKASNENDKAFYFWRLYVKQRLYVFNRDQLAQLEREERIEKLESALDSVLEAYVKMLERVERREKELAESDDTNGVDGSPAAVEGAAPKARKRKVVDEDEDEEDEGVAVNGHKKARAD